MQLIDHKMRVRFLQNGDVKREVIVQCADTEQSRQIGRDIGQWMARGVGAKVESETITCVWK